MIVLRHYLNFSTEKQTIRRHTSMKGAIKAFLTFFQNILNYVKPLLTERQFLYLSCILVGASSAGAVIVLKTFAHQVFHFSSYLTTIVQLPYFKSILPIIGILLTIYVVKRFLGGKIEKGTAQIMIAVAKRSGIMPKKQMYAQIVTSSLTVGMGGSAGLESPITITGAAFGSNYAQYYKFKYKHRTLLLACGVAAGIATAFNAPIAGVLFAIEVVLADMSVSAFIPLLLSSATGAILGKLAFQENVILTFNHQLDFNYQNTLYYVGLGIVAGFVSIFYARTFRKVEHTMDQSFKGVYAKGIVGASLLALLIFIFPSLFGEGYESIRLLADDKSAKMFAHSIFELWMDSSWIIWLVIVAIMLIKAIATGLTLGSGGNGGNFAPSLFVGSYLGFTFSKLFELLGWKSLPIDNFTVVGMAAVLSGLFHAPLTAIFLIAEMTGGYGLIIPLMIVTSISFAISKYYDKHPMDLYKIANKGIVFTSDKDRNLLDKIKVVNVMKKGIPLTYPFNGQQLLAAFNRTKNSFVPIVNPQGQILGVIYWESARERLVKLDDANDFSFDDLITTKKTFSKKSRTRIVLRYMDQSKEEDVLLTEHNQYVGYLRKVDILDAYRTNMRELRIE